MLDKNKTDPALGYRISNYLKELGLENPLILNTAEKSLTIDKIKEISNHFKIIMELLGLDLSDDSLIKTPDRIGKMFVNEIFYGLYPENFPKITMVQNKMKLDQMIFEKNISVKSFCEHHFLPFVGNCHIAYLPKDKVIGLSKLNRIVDYFCRRPQIQERLVSQIHAALCNILETEDVAVLIDAKHSCVSLRGIEDIKSSTKTSKISGIFKNNELAKQEFLKMIE